MHQSCQQTYPLKTETYSLPKFYSYFLFFIYFDFLKLQGYDEIDFGAPVSSGLEMDDEFLKSSSSIIDDRNFEELADGQVVRKLAGETSSSKRGGGGCLLVFCLLNTFKNLK